MSEKQQQIILIMPATNCMSEWSFSALSRVKTYLKSIIPQERLNYRIAIL